MNFLQNFHVATKYYSKFDYEFVEEVPVFIAPEVDNATKPPNAKIFSVQQNKKRLIASAEQSFIQMLEDGEELPEKCMAFSPCFRNEKKDFFHRKFFYKLELFVNLNKYKNVVLTYDDVEMMAKISLNFFSKFLIGCRIVKTGNMSCDIVTSDGIELGSYGYRNFKNYNWLYGTGLAEPRLSICIKNQKI